MFKFTYLESLENDLEKSATQTIIDFVDEEIESGVDDILIEDKISDFVHSLERVNREDYLDEYYTENVGKCERVALANFGTMTLDEIIETYGLVDFIYHISAMAKSDDIIADMVEDIDTIKRLWVVKKLLADGYDLIYDNVLDGVLENMDRYNNFRDIDLHIDERIRNASYAHLSIK